MSASGQPSEKRPAFMTTVEAAAYLRIKPNTLEGMRVKGTGPTYLKVGPGKKARVLYRLEDIDAWLEQYAFSNTSEYHKGS